MTSIIEGKRDAAAVIDAVERLDVVQEFLIPRGQLSQIAQVVALPSGKRLESLKPLFDQYLIRPERIVGTASLADETSFIEHVNEQKEPSTRIFANTEFSAPSLTAVYDYHAVEDDTQRPNWQQHRAVWSLKLSKEWQAWSAKAGKGMSHLEFAEFLEANVPDVYSGDEMSEYTRNLVGALELKLATASRLIALSRNLSVNVDSAVKSAQTLSSGEIAITYTETHKDDEGKPVSVPNAFLIAIPVLYGGAPYQVLVRLRYRIQNQRVAWFFELHRADLVFDAAVKEICARVAEATECTVFLGSPEK